jgi:hypothetical protein
MFRKSSATLGLFAATAPLADKKLYKRWQPGLYGKKRKTVAMRATDNTPAFNKGPVEWMPRPVHITYGLIEELQDKVMRQQLDGDQSDINQARHFMQDWGQHPKKPMLGDQDPKLPKGVFKANHIAYRRFVYRFHKANPPEDWLWLPRGNAENTGRWMQVFEYPENWKELRKAMGRPGIPAGQVAPDAGLPGSSPAVAK